MKNGSSDITGVLLSSDSDHPMRKYNYKIYITLENRIEITKKRKYDTFVSLHLREEHTQYDLFILSTLDTFL
jgi:hypothetical protein